MMGEREAESNTELEIERALIKGALWSILTSIKQYKIQQCYCEQTIVRKVGTLLHAMLYFTLCATGSDLVGEMLDFFLQLKGRLFYGTNKDALFQCKHGLGFIVSGNGS